jgi:hypothetical protein
VVEAVECAIELAVECAVDWAVLKDAVDIIDLAVDMCDLVVVERAPERIVPASPRAVGFFA